MAPIHFYFSRSLDYLGMLEDFQNTDEYNTCVTRCDKGPTCEETCKTNAHNGGKVIAKMVMAPKGDPLAGIIFTEVFRTPLSPTEMEAKGLTLVTQVDTGKDISELDVVDVTVQDLLSPHARLDGRTVCEAVGKLTDQALTAMNYIVNDQSNPRFVLNECVNIHARVKLGQIAAENAEDIINLLDDEAYKDFCWARKHEGDRETCEVIAPWMKAGDQQAPESICQLMQGRFFSSVCGVNTKQRDRIKAHLRDRVNACIAEMGCVYSDKKFMRRHTKANFPQGSIPTSICCKRSLKAVVKGALRMDRLYKMTKNMTLAEQIALVNDTSMTKEQKAQFLDSLQDADKQSEQLIADLNVDHPTEVFIETFAVMVRSSLGEALQEFTQMGTMEPKTDSDAEQKLIQITGSKERASRILGFLQKAATSVASIVIEASRLMMKAIQFFGNMGFSLVKYILHHPTTVMWVTYTAMAFKKELCKEISLKIFGDPEMVEVGLWAKSEDLYAQGVQKASRAYTIIKKLFLSVAYQSIDGGSFSAYIKRFTNLIESGLMMCIASIPVYGVVIVASLKTTSAFTTLITDSMKSAMLEGSKYAISAIMIKESYTDIVEILLGTCIAPPAAIKKLTIKAAGEEVDQAMIKNMKRPAEFNPFQRQQAAAAAPKDEAGKDAEESDFYKYIKSLKNRL